MAHEPVHHGSIIWEHRGVVSTAANDVVTVTVTRAASAMWTKQAAEHQQRCMLDSDAVWKRNRHEASSGVITMRVRHVGQHALQQGYSAIASKGLQQRIDAGAT